MAIKCLMLTELELSEDFLTNGNSFRGMSVSISHKGFGWSVTVLVFLHVFSPLKFCLGFLCSLCSITQWGEWPWFHLVVWPGVVSKALQRSFQIVCTFLAFLCPLAPARSSSVGSWRVKDPGFAGEACLAPSYSYFYGQEPSLPVTLSSKMKVNSIYFTE